MKDMIFQTDCKRNRIIAIESVTHRGVTTPNHYRSDGLSKGFSKYQPRGLRGAVYHDYCCSSRIIGWKKAAIYTREIWKEDGVSWFARNRWYYAIRAYGMTLFKKGSY